MFPSIYNTDDLNIVLIFFELSVGFLRVTSYAQAAENIKNFIKNPPKDPLRHQIWFKTKERVRDYLVSISKTNLLVKETKTEVNQVLGLPLTLSTQRRESRTSKQTELKSNSVLAKFGLNEG